MSDTAEAGAKKKRGGGAGGGKKAAGGAGAGAGLRGWDSANEGAAVARTTDYDSPDRAIKAAQRALSAFQRAGHAVEVRVDGASVTIRVDTPEGGAANDEKLAKVAKRFGKSPAKKAARKAKKTAQKAEITSRPPEGAAPEGGGES